jgi:hypothetical protein
LFHVAFFGQRTTGYGQPTANDLQPAKDID